MSRAIGKTPIGYVGADLTEQRTRRYPVHMCYLEAVQGQLRMLPARLHGGHHVYIDDVKVGWLSNTGRYVGRRIHIATMPRTWPTSEVTMRNG